MPGGTGGGRAKRRQKRNKNMELAERFAKAAQSFRDELQQIADDNAKPVLTVYGWWREYSKTCDSYDQSPVMFEFLQWYDAQLRLVAGVFPTGIGYADRKTEQDGDYRKLAFLPFSSLVLEWKAEKMAVGLRELIEQDAKAVIARRGENYQTSTTGQFVVLGA